MRGHRTSATIAEPCRTTTHAPVANAERTKKVQVLGDSASGLDHFPVTATNVARTKRMTQVRISVAKSESTPGRPIFAKIAVSAAKTAENKAQ